MAFSMFILLFFLDVDVAGCISEVGEVGGLLQADTETFLRYYKPRSAGVWLGFGPLSAYVFGPLAPWGLGPLASGGLDSHRSEVEEFLMGLAGPPEPILGLGLVSSLSVAVEGRHMASVSETEGSDGFLVGHLVWWVGGWS